VLEFKKAIEVIEDNHLREISFEYEKNDITYYIEITKIRE